MDKKLHAHERMVIGEIARLERDLKTATATETAAIHRKIKQLYRYHQMTVRDFQHERFIHLIVTFFFGGLMLISFGAMFVLELLPNAGDYFMLSVMVMILSSILLVTELFYVRHYYQLENGTQRLYILSKRLFELLSSDGEK